VRYVFAGAVGGATAALVIAGLVWLHLERDWGRPR